MFCVFLFWKDSLHEQLGNAIRIIVEKTRDESGVSAFDKSLTFQLLPVHHFGRIAVKCADTGSDIKLDSMKLPSAMIELMYSTQFF